eukprot:4969694-Lingulodinium_polyedra.AAC.1
MPVHASLAGGMLARVMLSLGNLGYNISAKTGFKGFGGTRSGNMYSYDVMCYAVTLSFTRESVGCG